MIPKPIECVPNDVGNTARLEFNKDEWLALFPEDKEWWGEWYLRGGICWPVYLEGQDRIEGFAIVAGRQLSTGRVVIFEQTRWVTVEPLVGETGRIEISGLVQWLRGVWGKYACDTYYWGGVDIPTANTYMLEIHRSKVIGRPMRFIEVLWGDELMPVHLLWSMVTLGKLYHDKQDADETPKPLYEALMRFRSDSSKVAPAVKSIFALLAGMDRFPYRQKIQK